MNELKKIISLSLLFFLAACQSVTSSAHINEKEVVEAFQRNNMDLVEANALQGDVFSSKLKGEKPGIYKLNEKLIVVYEFDTADDRKDGKRMFVEKTATMNLVSYSQFVKRNILIFYVHGENLNSTKIPFETEIKEALDSLVEG